ncbi:MAG: DUF5985 family protein [Myxococcota bacterium]
MNEAVYLLCAVTSLLCVTLLVRSYLATRARLLLWSSLCFSGLALHNIGLVIDKAAPDVDLSLARSVPAFAGMLLLLYGLIWESRR